MKIQSPVQTPESVTAGKKNGFLAALYSIVLPGMGELYAGDYSSGKYFTIAEGALWGAYAGFNLYGQNQKDNYEAFAAAQGGVAVEGKDDQYWADISGYLNIERFNREKLLNRDFNGVYDPATHFWDWKTDAVRKEYRNMWRSSEQAFNNVRFVVWGMLINRVISAINAVRIVAKHNKKIKEKVSWNISAGAFREPNLPEGMRLNFQLKF